MVTKEARLDTDTPFIEFREMDGVINSDLSIGADVTTAASLLANQGICSPGVKLHGEGFIVTKRGIPSRTGKTKGLEKHIRGIVTVGI